MVTFKKHKQWESLIFCLTFITLFCNCESCSTGVNSIAADLAEQKLTIIGDMDTIAVAKKLKKIGKIDLVSVGPAKEEEKEEKKEETKDETK